MTISWRNMLAIAGTLAIAAATFAQTAPEGNAHPKTQAISDATAGERNPFGEPVPQTLDIDAKRAFATAVDLSPLRDLAVFHNGRVKILDTLARETVKDILGRRDFVDFKVNADSGKADSRHYDALFTLMDVVIDPAYYLDKPLIHVEYLPLREAMLDSMYPLPANDLTTTEEGQALAAAIARSGGQMLELGRLWQAGASDRARNSATMKLARSEVDRLLATLPPDHAERRVLESVRILLGRDDEHEWWKRLGRLKPGELMQAWRTIGPSLPMDAPTQRGLGQMNNSFSLYQDSWRNLLMIAPQGAEVQWHHLSDQPAGSAVANAAAAMGAAWRAGDAAKVNEAIRTLAAELPKINAANYPEGRRSLEATYNRMNAFEWGYWLYAFALLLLLLAFGTGRKWLAIAGVATLVSAVGMHGFGFIARCIIAERFAIQNQYESMTGLSLFAALVGTVIMIARRQWLFGAAAAGVGFMVLITATQTGIPGSSVEREAAILNTSVLLKYHVTTVLVSYGLISLGFMVSLFYLGTHYAARLKASMAGGMATPALALGQNGPSMSAEALGLEEGELAGTARVLSDLDKSQMIILQLAFWTLGVGILLGAWWADHSWGRWWAFDPKELWALVTWIVYLIVIHLRLTGMKNRGLVTAWMSVVGFIVMLWTYFGVNLLLPGLHAYA